MEKLKQLSLAANSIEYIKQSLDSLKNLTDEEVLQDVLLLNSDVKGEDIEHIETTKWEKALPVYDLQLYLAVKKLHQLAQQENDLAIFGNYVAGISLREMITAAKTFARSPLDYPEAT